MAKTILVDFDTESREGRDFEVIRPIGVLLEYGEAAGFESLYDFAVTDEQDSGHDNYVRTMQATEEQRAKWDQGEDPGVSVAELFTYIADQSYIGTRFRTVGIVDDSVTLTEAYERFVENQEPLPVIDDEELPRV